MSKRNIFLYLDDILDSSQAIHVFLKDVTFDEFCQDRKTFSATIREFIVIGEAISKSMSVLESRFPDYDWRMIKDFRNFIVHEYFGVDEKIVWDAACLELKELEIKVAKLKSESESENNETS